MQLAFRLASGLGHQTVAFASDRENKVGRELVLADVGVEDLRINFDFDMLARDFVLFAEDNRSEIAADRVRIGASAVRVAQDDNLELVIGEIGQRSRKAVDPAAVADDLAIES